MIEEVKHGEQVLAIIVHGQWSSPGVGSFTPKVYSPQLTHMCHPSVKTITPRIREVQATQDALSIESVPGVLPEVLS